VEKAQLAEKQRKNVGLTETTTEPVTTQSEIIVPLVCIIFEYYYWGLLFYR